LVKDKDDDKVKDKDAASANDADQGEANEEKGAAEKPKPKATRVTSKDVLEEINSWMAR